MEYEHVKDSFLAKFQLSCKFGKAKPRNYNDFITDKNYKFCKEVKSTGTITWYPLTLDVFIKFLHVVRPRETSFLKIVMILKINFCLLTHVLM